jgi:hypothetical protein
MTKTLYAKSLEEFIQIMVIKETSDRYDGVKIKLQQPFKIYKMGKPIKYEIKMTR